MGTLLIIIYAILANLLVQITNTLFIKVGDVKKLGENFIYFAFWIVVIILLYNLFFSLFFSYWSKFLSFWVLSTISVVFSLTIWFLFQYYVFSQSITWPQILWLFFIIIGILIMNFAKF